VVLSRASFERPLSCMRCLGRVMCIVVLIVVAGVESGLEVKMGMSMSDDSTFNFASRSRL